MVTIFTPTYNRKDLLKLLKRSLDQQTDMDFEWIIVDDGSTDHTFDIVNEWKHCANYPIRYYRQENSGKHIAFNKAVEMAAGDTFICVDSDDQLGPEAVKWIKNDFSALSAQDIGVVSPRLDKNGRCETNWHKIDTKKVDIIDLKEVYGIVESAIVMRTNILKNNEPFAKFDNEKFLPEGWLYMELCEVGKFMVRSRGYYIAEYQATGLTRNLWKHWQNNYKGVLATLKKKYNVSKKYDLCKRKVVQTKVILNINALCFAVHANIFKFTPSKAESVLLLIPAWFVYRIRYKRQ